MKILLKFASMYFMLACSSLFANAQEIQDLEVPIPIKNSFVYVNGGIAIGWVILLYGFPSPSLGIGYRKQVGHHGLDLSASITTNWIDWAKVKTSFLYNWFFKTNLHSQFYAGVGVAMSCYELLCCKGGI